MKIERLNDNQIRCILSLNELVQHHVTLKNISLDDPAARGLIREMILQSQEEVGFEPNDLPVMVEAFRNESGDYTFTITKINSIEDLPPQYRANEALRAVHSLMQMVHQQQTEQQVKQPIPLAVFSYDGGAPVLLPPRLQTTPPGVNSALYFQPKTGQSVLIISAKPKAIDEFRRVCLLMSEYARQIPSVSASQAHYAEHYETVYAHRAIERIREAQAAPASE